MNKLEKLQHHKNMVKQLEREIKAEAKQTTKKSVENKAPDQLDQVSNILMGKSAIPEPEGKREVLYAPRMANLGKRL